MKYALAAAILALGCLFAPTPVANADSCDMWKNLGDMDGWQKCEAAAAAARGDTPCTGQTVIGPGGVQIHNPEGCNPDLPVN
jgi:hypothetical protein